jgi:3-oxoacyl-[acyl-carrier-protein] synthase-3
MPLVFRRAVIETIAAELPPEVVTSAEIERRLAPVYERLRLPEGRLELMTGIRERRFWPAGVLPSEAAARAGRKALNASGVPAARIGLLVHAAVCRDLLEPATATFVHARLGLPGSVQVCDVSNACLGFLNALTFASALVDAGQIEAALVVTGENGGPLLEETVARLLGPGIDRRSIKPFFANLTIGGGAAAAVVCRDDLAAEGRRHRLLGGAARADTQHAHLCQGDATGTGGLAMQTDSEALLEAGVAAAATTFREFLGVVGWQVGDIDRAITHQVGTQHQKRLFTELGLDPVRGHITFDRLGNAGSASCPMTLALAEEAGLVRAGQRVALLGIGSGIHTLMLGVEW